MTLVALVVLGAASRTYWVHQQTAMQGDSAHALATLHAACVSDMIASTCKIMGTGSASAPAAKPGALVFVAGIGPIDAVSYQEMFAAGDAMCSVVRQACITQWDSNQCMLARKMWLNPP